MPTPESLKIEAARAFPGELPEFEGRAANDDGFAGCADAAPLPAGAAPLIVVDTNVVLDIVYWENPQALPILEALRAGRLIAAVDLDAALELAEVLSREKFGLSAEEALARWREWMALCRPVAKAAVRRAAEACQVRCRDPLDQKFLVLAIAAGAAAIVTRDKLVLKAGRAMKKRYGIAALTPRAALDVL